MQPDLFGEIDAWREKLCQADQALRSPRTTSGDKRRLTRSVIEAGLALVAMAESLAHECDRLAADPQPGDPLI